MVLRADWNAGILHWFARILDSADKDREKKGRCYIIIKKNKFFAMMQSAKTSVFDDVSYRNIPNENKKQADSVMPNPPLGVYGSASSVIIW